MKGLIRDYPFKGWCRRFVGEQSWVLWENSETAEGRCESWSNMTLQEREPAIAGLEVCLCVCVRADERGRKINPGWNCTRSAELVWCRLAFLIISIQASQGSVLWNPVCGLTNMAVQGVDVALMNCSLLQWTKKNNQLKLVWSDEQSLQFLSEQEDIFKIFFP